MVAPERISLELTNECGKGCDFCYNESHRLGESGWSVAEIVSFIADCAAHGTKAVSLGGGEPLDYAGVYEVLSALDGVVYRSMTTHGLYLDRADVQEKLLAARPDKVHVSIHFPERQPEVERVIRQVHWLREHDIAAGVNLLVRRSQLPLVARVARQLWRAKIGNDAIVYLPMKYGDTPNANEIAKVAGQSFQSMTCLQACAKSPRFCSISWDKTVAWCSYTKTARKLEALTAEGLRVALDGLGLQYCGEATRVERMV